LVSLGMRNSRMKDFFDLWVIARTFAFDGATLRQAIAATLERRKTPLPIETPLALTDAFANDAGKQTQWRAFLNRTTLALAPEPLSELIAFIAAFVLPLLGASDTVVVQRWAPGGPWASA
jgi:hypothetical protein